MQEELMGETEYLQFLAYRWDVTAAQAMAETMPVRRLDPRLWFPLLSAVTVDEEYVRRADLSRPLILVKVRELQGSLIIDGWHRLARARAEGVGDLPFVRLDEDQEFRVRIFGGTKRPPLPRGGSPASRDGQS
jgi:hypothetical protein